MTEYINSSPLKEPLIFDTHAHYDDECFEAEGDALFDELHNHGVGGIITCGCDKESSLKAIEIAEKHDYIYAAVGIHPCNIDSGSTVAETEAICRHKKCVAIGEIGLDYYWNSDEKQAQKEIFSGLLELSNKYSLPVSVHDREAHGDTLDLLKAYKPKGAVHCFSGSVEMAKEILDLGMYIGVGGVITFKNAKKLPDVVKYLPEDRLLLETDAPYLAPVPYRSKTNNSAMIYLTAQKIAEIRETSVEHILKVTFKNAKELFNIK